MGELYEIVLEEVPTKSLFLVLNKLTAYGSSLVRSEIQGDESFDLQIDWNNSETFERIVEKIISGFALIGEIRTIDIGGLFLRNSGLRVIYYENKFDIEVNFKAENNTDLNAEKLSSFFCRLCKDFNVVQTFAGIEPASDQETRIFTGTKLGPIEL